MELFCPPECREIQDLCCPLGPLLAPSPSLPTPRAPQKQAAQGVRSERVQESWRDGKPERIAPTAAVRHGQHMAQPAPCRQGALLIKLAPLFINHVLRHASSGDDFGLVLDNGEAAHRRDGVIGISRSLDLPALIAHLELLDDDFGACRCPHF